MPAGNKTPSIGFICPFGNPMPVLNNVWKDLYQPGLWRDLWFRWEGKPLILANPQYVKDPDDASVLYISTTDARLLEGPQRSGPMELAGSASAARVPECSGEAEQMSVGVAQNALPDTPGPAPMTHRRAQWDEAGTTRRKDPRPGAVNLGLNFDEQWRRAMEVDPKFIFVTGWNEWIAGRYHPMVPLLRRRVLLPRRAIRRSV